MSASGEIPEVLQRGLPNAVTYDLTSLRQVTVTLPPGSTWSSELHWHETHTEYLKVIKGSIKVRLGGAEHIITATEESRPEVKVDRYVWHEWQRAELEGEEVVVIERTDPADGEKAVFFWNLNGVILNAGKTLNARVPIIAYCPAKLQDLATEVWITLNLFIIFKHLDNFPVFANVPRLAQRTKLYVDNTTIEQCLKVVDWVLTHLVFYFVSLIGRLLGLEPVRPEYTPKLAYATWIRKQEDRLRKQKNL